MRRLLCSIALLMAAAVHAQPEVERLLQAGEEPGGVVFEIVESEEGDLLWALPKVARLSAQLRGRYPGLSIVVVTHGREQFGLLASEAVGPLEPVHQAALGLRDADIGLHVCGVHAGWLGHEPEDFPDYVDVAASGPAQIRDYENLGFEVIRLDQDD
jgi:hypothetical protein